MRTRKEEIGKVKANNQVGKNRKETTQGNSQLLKSNQEKLAAALVKKIQQQEDAGIKQEGKRGFFACYLLCSLCPRLKDQTYIGFTVDPCRRIKQHNGEMRAGAGTTKLMRPCEMVLCVYGFKTKKSALQFEWAWQHPTESLTVRDAAVKLNSLYGIAANVKLAYTMLTLPPWQSWKLTVNYFSTKYMTYAAGCPSLPKQIKVQFCPIDELPCYTGAQIFEDMDHDTTDEDDNESRTSSGCTSSNHTSETVENRDTLIETKQELPMPRAAKDCQPSFSIKSGTPSRCRSLNLTSETVENRHTLMETKQEFPMPIAAKDCQPSFGIKSGTQSRCRSLNSTSEAVEDRDTLMETKQEQPITRAAKDCQPSFDIKSGTPSRCRSLNLTSETVEDRDTLTETKQAMLTPRASKDCQPSFEIETGTPSRCRSLKITSETVEDRYSDVLSPDQSPESLLFSEISQLSSKSSVASTELEVIDISTPEKTPSCTNSGITDTLCHRQFSVYGDSAEVKTLETVEDKDGSELTRESIYRETPLFDDTEVPSSKRNLASPEVKVIDISTPSSNNMFCNFRRKKRRNNWVSQEIIDLTKVT